MNNYYSDEKRSREFIEGYIYDYDKSGNPVIVIFTGSGEYIVLLDNALNRLKLKRYQDKMIEQVKEGKRMLPNLIKKQTKMDNKLSKMLYRLYALSILILITVFFVLNNSFLAGICLICFTANIGLIGTLEIIKGIQGYKSNKIIDDIEKNAYFYDFNDILIESLCMSDKSLVGLSSKTVNMVKDFYEAEELNLNACNALTLDEVIQIRDNLQKEAENKKVIPLNIKNIDFEGANKSSYDGEHKILSFKPKSNFKGY